MKLAIRLFAGARQAAGADSIEVELPAGATIAELRAALVARQPALAPIVRHARFAVDAQYAADDQRIASPAVEVALIPPVSGG